MSSRRQSLRTGADMDDMSFRFRRGKKDDEVIVDRVNGAFNRRVEPFRSYEKQSVLFEIHHMTDELTVGQKSAGFLQSL